MTTTPSRRPSKPRKSPGGAPASPPQAPDVLVDPDALMVGAGVTAVLQMLLFVLCDQNDGCLIPAPYFTGYDSDVADPRVAVKALPVENPSNRSGLDSVDEGIAPTVLEAARREAVANGTPPKVLLLASPHNPTGKCYSAAALLSAVEWARGAGLHTIADEIYAGSVYGDGAVHTSLIRALDGDLEGDVHVLYGVSKDFGCAGWRVGGVYTKNAAVREAIAPLAHAHEASTRTLAVFQELFADSVGTAAYLSANRAALRGAYTAVTAALSVHRVEFIPAEAGVFVLLDLRKHLKTATFRAEAALWQQMFDSCNVNLTPGHAMHVKTPGWFRLCFAAVPTLEAVEAVERIASLLRRL